MQGIKTTKKEAVMKLRIDPLTMFVASLIAIVFSFHVIDEECGSRDVSTNIPVEQIQDL